MSGGEPGLSARFRGAVGGFDIDAAFDAPMRGITALFGRSGSGKTTILRCVAGLHRLAGRLSIGKEVWQDERTFLRPHRRRVGYVFQEASLFPHLSVRRNLLYGRRRALRDQPRKAGEFHELVALFGLGPLLDRSPAHLSGGERQRVALGRALLSDPVLLLMDEPLAGLDQAAREEILPYFEALHATLRIPALYVSHDIREVERLADHVVLLDSGRVAAAGPLAEILVDPALPIARQVGSSAIVFATIRGYDPADEVTTLDLAGNALYVAGRPGEAGRDVRVRIAAADVSLAVEPPSRTTILNVLPARISEIDLVAGGQASLVLVLGHGHDPSGTRILARISRRSLAQLSLAVGMDVWAQVKSVSMLASRET